MNNEADTGTGTPPNARALTQARQTAEDEIGELLKEGANTWMVLALITAGIAVYEWLRWWHDASIHPAWTSIAAVLVVAYCVPRIVGLRKRARRLQYERERKRETTAYLERLREGGCAVFHDVAGDDSDIDHVVLSEKGIYVVETKPLPKPFTKAQIHCDAAKVVVDGVGDQSDLVEQVARNARWLKGLLKEATGRDFPVKPVIVFPEWIVLDGIQERYWVISPRALPSIMEKQGRTLKPEDAHLAAYHLSRHIRAAV